MHKDSQGDELILEDDAWGKYWYTLADKRLKPGDHLEILLVNDRWQLVRFEWAHKDGVEPHLYFPADYFFKKEARGVPLMLGARFRWPEEHRG